MCEGESGPHLFTCSLRLFTASSSEFIPNSFHFSNQLLPIALIFNNKVYFVGRNLEILASDAKTSLLLGETRLLDQPSQSELVIGVHADYVITIVLISGLEEQWSFQHDCPTGSPQTTNFKINYLYDGGENDGIQFPSLLLLGENQMGQPGAVQLTIGKEDVLPKLLGQLGQNRRTRSYHFSGMWSDSMISAPSSRKMLRTSVLPEAMGPTRQINMSFSQTY